MSADGILALTTGGTIDKFYSVRGNFDMGPPQLGELLAEVGSHAPVEVVEVCRKDSLDLTDADRAAIRAQVEAHQQRRVLIVHGTDTMVETAAALGGLAGRTIVLTGAMQPRTVRRSDAEFNIGFALAAAGVLPPGVYIAMNGQVFAADRVRKDYDLGRFVATE